MGNTLNKEKNSDTRYYVENGGTFMVVSGMQGYRDSMEDTHNSAFLATPGVTFFNVNDGHGKSIVCAKFLEKNYGSFIEKFIDKTRIHSEDEDDIRLNIWDIQEASLATDDQFLLNDTTMCGSTMVGALFTKHGCYLFHAGDSKYVMAVDGDVDVESTDHRAFNAEESKRIINAGGNIDWGRVDGILAPSRSFGDSDMKNLDDATISKRDRKVTACPEVIYYKINKNVDFLVLACDGIWDVLSPQQAISFIYKQICDGFELAQIADNLLDECASLELGVDNMTCMIIALLHGESEKTWYEKIRKNYNINSENSWDEIKPDISKYRKVVSTPADKIDQTDEDNIYLEKDIKVSS